MKTINTINEYDIISPIDGPERTGQTSSVEDC